MKKIFITLLILITGISFFIVGSAREGATKRIRLKKPNIVDSVSVRYNNWSYMMGNNGSYMYDRYDIDANRGNNAGGEFPRGSAVTVVYAGGFMLGAIRNGSPVVSEAQWSTEFQPGRIINSGVSYNDLESEDPLSPLQQVYLIDRARTGDDYTNWPSDAPRNSKGDPALIADAQTWAVFNDQDTSLIENWNGQDRILGGLGVQITLESFASNFGILANSVFFKFTVANKTNTDHDSAYIAIWMDPDVDDSSNDYGGCDTVSHRAFIYNSISSWPEAPRAVAIQWLQGPVVKSSEIPLKEALKFQNNKTVMVYDPLVNRYKSQTLDPDHITLDPTTFLVHDEESGNRDMYYHMAGLDHYGQLRWGTGANDYYNYRGDPLGPNADTDPNVPHGSPWDIKVTYAAGPFIFKANSTQELWVAIAGGISTDRLGALRDALRNADMARTGFSGGFSSPEPLWPNLSVSSLDRKIFLTWQNNAELSEDLSGELTGISTANGYTADYLKNDFQGYRVYRSLTGLEGSFELLAQYDKVDEFGYVTDRRLNTRGVLEMNEIHIGDNTGLRYSYTDTKLINGQNYFYSVTAFDAQPYIGSPDSILLDGYYVRKPAGITITQESPMLANVVSVVPAGSIATLRDDAFIDTAGVIHYQGISDGSVSLEIVDPSKVITADYRIEFFEIPPDSGGGTLTGSEFLPENRMAYRFLANDSIQSISTRTDDPRTFYDVNVNGFFDENTDVILDDSKFATEQIDRYYPETGDGCIVNGIKAFVYGPPFDIKRFLCVANGTGILATPDMACFAFNGSGFPTSDGLPPDVELGNERPNLPNLLAVPGAASVANGGKWGFHAGGTGTDLGYYGGSTSFFNRVFRNDNVRRLVPYDYEMRFTAAGGQAQFVFTSGNQAPVPFELWNIGIGTPTDTDDDYRLYPLINDEGGAPDVWDYTGFDHPISGGDNDPYTDWIYWIRPPDLSPGQAGYDMCVAAGTAAFAGEIMARTVLVNFNGGTVTDTTFPANVNQLRPANGTIFRIISTKPNAPGDIFTFSTTANSVLTTKKDLKRALKDIKVVPNPFYKYSSYETNFDKMIKFTNLPEVCTIRIFNVAGDLVKTIKHNSTSNNDRVNNRPYDEEYEPGASSTSIEQWDLKTSNGRYVASGMYIALVESSAGKRFVKFAVIQ